MFYHGLKTGMLYWIFSCLIVLQSYGLLAFFQLLNRLTERTEFWCAISIWYIAYSDNGYNVLN